MAMRCVFAFAFARWERQQGLCGWRRGACWPGSCDGEGVQQSSSEVRGDEQMVQGTFLRAQPGQAAWPGQLRWLMPSAGVEMQCVLQQQRQASPPLELLSSVGSVLLQPHH